LLIKVAGQKNKSFVNKLLSWPSSGKLCNENFSIFIYSLKLVKLAYFQDFLYNPYYRVINP